MDEGSRPIRARVRDGCRPHRSWPVSLAVFDCGLRQVFVRLLPAKTVKTCLDFLIGSWVKLVLEVKSTGLGQRNVFKWSCFSAAVLKKEEREERERELCWTSWGQKSYWYFHSAAGQNLWYCSQPPVLAFSGSRTRFRFVSHFCHRRGGSRSQSQDSMDGPPVFKATHRHRYLSCTFKLTEKTHLFSSCLYLKH